MLVPSVSESNFWNLNQIFLNKKEKNHPSWLFENYLNANFNRVIFTLFIALVYLIGARIGQVLSIPPGNVTPIWPPSGVAMAVILMYGYSIWPGIFFGALLGNTWAFLDPTNFHTMVKTTSAGAIIGMGATLQAVCGAYLINHVIKDNQPFNKFINVVQFFILGIVSCLISSTIGSIALSLFGIDEWKHFLKIWSTWFLGDSTGILIFAPFLLVWFRYPLIQLQKTEKIHLFFFILLLCIASLFIFLLPYNLIYVFIPFLIYGAFRFGLYGATLSVLIAALVSNSLTILGYGPFIYRTLNESLLTLQMFIGIIALTTLIVSALLEELKENRLTLEVKVAEKTANLALTIEKMKEMQNQMITQEKLTSLGIICSGIAHEIKNPLNFINNFSVLTLKLIEDLEGNFQSRDYSDIFDIIKKNIRSVLEQGKKADYIVEKMFLHGSQSGREFKLVDINQLLEDYLFLTSHSMKTKFILPIIDVKKNYDLTLSEINIVPEDIGRVIINIVSNSFYALELKKAKLGDNFKAEVFIQTKKLGEDICEIRIRDNGIGIPRQDIEKIFTPFFTSRPPNQGVGLGLSICYDIVVKEHQGKLFFETLENEFTEFIIQLPKL